MTKPSSSISNNWESLFTEQATLQRMLDFEVALAKAEATCGAIPKTAPPVIARFANAELFNAQEIAAAARQSGNNAIPLVKALTAEVQAIDPDAARYVHWGATSQDVIDTGLMLQLRDAFALAGHDLTQACEALAALAETHRQTPVVARTWMQQAIPISLGLKFAGWLDALERQRVRMTAARESILALQFGGAAGSLAALGDKGIEVSEALAGELDLPLPEVPWHTHRDRVVEAASLFGLLAGTLGKIARDISLMAQTEVGELAEPASDGRGGSSTMPHKRNPVSCAAIIAIAIRVPGLVGTMFSAMLQEHERALGGWQAEWETLPQIVSLTGEALRQTLALLQGLVVYPDRMLQNLETTRGLIYAESAAMLLATRIGKAAAHQLVEEASHKALSESRHLKDVLTEDARVRSHFANADIAKLFDPTAHFGAANTFITRVTKTPKE